MSNFTAKRRNAGTPTWKMTGVDLAKVYADSYGYEMRGGSVYGPDGGRVCRGWAAFAAQLEQDGKMTPGRPLPHRFAVGDRLVATSMEGKAFPPFTVERAEHIGVEPMYRYRTADGLWTYALDHQCAPA